MSEYLVGYQQALKDVMGLAKNLRDSNPRLNRETQCYTGLVEYVETFQHEARQRVKEIKSKRAKSRRTTVASRYDERGGGQ